MKKVVITGSTRGIGFAMARAFLKRDCQVVISGRKAVAVKIIVKKLKQEFSADRVAGFACDVTHFEQVQKLWDQAAKRFGSIDFWVNNAGISNEQSTPWELTSDKIRSVVETNVLGELYGTKVAMQGFIKQGYGALYNVEGMGSRGKSNVKGLSIYGTTKAGLHYFNLCLADEVNNPHIITGSLQPGMVLTDMIRGQYEDKPEEWQKVKGILTILSGSVDTVAAWLVDKMLTNTKKGAHLAYGGTLRILGRLLNRPFNKQINE
jgi:NAD(P)-dependent dehydrogenase (short-subunit alcohol dehydrogenase family)